MLYYAVLSNKKIYKRWGRLQEYLKQNPKATYKEFTSLSDANHYLENLDYYTGLERDCLLAFVDGSYLKSIDRHGSAFVILDWVNQVVFEDAFLPSLEIPAELFATGKKNWIGECASVLRLLKWVSVHQSDRSFRQRKMYIFYDCENLASWIGNTNCRSPLAVFYQREVAFYLSIISIDIEFVKVKGHSAIYWNDYVDKMAKDVAGFGV